MGEATRRRQEEARLRAGVLDGLSGDAAMIATTAIALFERFVLPKRYTGGCYLTTMFLNRFLREEHDIATQAVIGYVNDGTDDIFTSHAWLEVEGLKTDLTLNVVEHGHAVPNGAALVLDRVLREGKVRHSYHLQPTEAGLNQNRSMMDVPELRALLQHKDREHREMLDRAVSAKAMASFMAGAPPGLRYEDMRGAVQ